MYYLNCAGVINSYIWLFLFLIPLSCGQIPKSSVTFVIDDTGSMGDDIDRVIYGAKLVFDSVLNTNGSQIEDFILVTFNDPSKYTFNILKYMKHDYLVRNYHNNL